MQYLCMFTRERTKALDEQHQQQIYIILYYIKPHGSTVYCSVEVYRELCNLKVAQSLCELRSCLQKSPRTDAAGLRWKREERSYRPQPCSVSACISPWCQQGSAIPPPDR